MKIPRIDKTYRNLKRYRQIVAVLVRYGFAEFLDRMHLAPYLRLGRRFLRRGKAAAEEEVRPTVGERMRMALEELGPTFIKLGQVLSTRSFLLPPEIVSELAKLQDRVRPIPFDALREQVETELGAPISQLFPWFDEEAMASASLAQAHRARTRAGQEVVVKIQKPNIHRVIRTDMDILQDLAGLLDRYVPESRQFDPPGLARELSRTLHRELDFMNEGRNVEAFAKNFREVSYVRVPKVFWEWTTSKVITLEFIDGIKISEVDQLQARGYDLKQIAARGARFILKQVFEDGFFHADPHPGNLFIAPGDVIVPIDFGMMGRLDDVLMDQIADLFIAIVRRDIDLILRVLVNLGAFDESRDPRPLRADIAEFMGRYHGAPLKQINLKAILSEVFEAIYQHRLKVPSNLVLLMKTLGTYEDLGRKLDPDFELIAYTKPYLGKIIRQKVNVPKLGYDGLKVLRDLYDLLRIFPREMELLLGRLKRGEVSFEFQHRGLEQLILEVDRSSNRISFSLIIAALIVGSSLILRLEVGPFLLGYPFFGLLGYLFAALLGVWLVMAILRSGKL